MKEINEMLNYFEFNSLEEFMKNYGMFNKKDGERLLCEMYEEETAPAQ